MKTTKGEVILKKYCKISFLWLVFLLSNLVVISIHADDSAIDSLEYYKDHFHKKPKHPLADTLFERTVWHKKVSHIVLEEKKNSTRVTLLMILPYPHNYKSQNYAIYYEFKTYQQAFEKFVWLNQFLKDNGVARVTLNGSTIVKEEILYSKESK